MCSCDVTYTAVQTVKTETEKCVPTERVDSLPLSSMAFLIGHSHGPEAINSTPYTTTLKTHMADTQGLLLR